MDSESWTVWVLVLGIAILVLLLMDVAASSKRLQPDVDFFARSVVSNNTRTNIPNQQAFPVERTIPIQKTVTEKEQFQRQPHQIKDNMPYQTVPQPRGPSFALIPVKDDPNYGPVFWTFRVIGSPDANWTTPLRSVLTASLPIPPTSHEAACLFKPVGNMYGPHDAIVPLISKGGAPVHVYFVHPSGYKVPVDARIGAAPDGQSLIITIDLKQSVLPASWYKDGSFTMFRGKDCTACS